MEPNNFADLSVPTPSANAEVSPEYKSSVPIKMEKPKRRNTMQPAVRYKEMASSPKSDGTEGSITDSPRLKKLWKTIPSLTKKTTSGSFSTSPSNSTFTPSSSPSAYEGNIPTITTTQNTTNATTPLSASMPILPTVSNNLLSSSPTNGGIASPEHSDTEERRNSLTNLSASAPGPNSPPEKFTNRNSKGKISKIESEFDLPEGFLGELVNSYRAVYHRKVIHHGRLYIYPQFICFLSVTNRTSVRIPFTEVSEIKLKKSVGVVPNAVQIYVGGPEGEIKKYRFSHLVHRGATFKVLSLVWNHARGDQSVSMEDVRSMCNKKKKDVEPFDPEGSQVGIPTEGEGGQLSDLGNPNWKGESAVVMPPESPQLVPYCQPPTDRIPDLEAEFSVSLVKMWRFFIGDQATHFVDAHIAKGDKNVTSTTWVEADQEGKKYLTRTLTLDSDVKSALLKGRVCAITSAQQCWMVSPTVMQLQTESKSEGVPYASDFIARTHWEFTANGQHRTTVRVWVWMSWLRNPFVKGTIERSGIKGMTEFSTIWVDLAHQRITAAQTPGKATDPSAKDNKQGTTTTATTQNSNNNNDSLLVITSKGLFKALLCVVLLLSVVCVVLYWQTQSYASLVDDLSTRLRVLESTRGDSEGGLAGWVADVTPRLSTWATDIARIQEEIQHFTQQYQQQTKQ